MRVGLIAPPWVAVPPRRYGGTEVVVDQLARGLAPLGCEVVLFATGDSTCPVARRWVFPRALGTIEDESAELAHVRAAYAGLSDVDLIHDHTDAGPCWAAAHTPGCPVVTTIHGKLTAAVRARYAVLAASGIAVVAISRAQCDGIADLPVSAVIHHGIDLESFPMGSGDGGYALFLGRMNPVKGVHRAIAIAREAGKQLLIAAKMWEPGERRYFAERVEPMLGDDAIYVGEVDHRCKVELLAGAEALVNPIRWPEPFGLVMIEALACGTPVLAFGEGAAPEIVVDGRTGYICRDDSDMAAKLGRVAALERAHCRERVAQAFTTERMATDHVRLYTRLARRAGIGQAV